MHVSDSAVKQKEKEREVHSMWQRNEFNELLFSSFPFRNRTSGSYGRMELRTRFLFMSNSVAFLSVLFPHLNSDARKAIDKKQKKEKRVEENHSQRKALTHYMTVQRVESFRPVVTICLSLRTKIIISRISQLADSVFV